MVLVVVRSINTAAAGARTSSPVQGFAGGVGGPAGNNAPGAGGGGAGAVGVTPANNTSNGGNGGAGAVVGITGADVTYAGGGGGSVESGTAGTGGSGGGGGGASGNAVAVILGLSILAVVVGQDFAYQQHRRCWRFRNRYNKVYSVIHFAKASSLVTSAKSESVISHIHNPYLY